MKMTNIQNQLVPFQIKYKALFTKAEVQQNIDKLK
jgi:hypothetical protein